MNARKNAGRNDGAVAVKLKKQPVLPICAEAVEECNRKASSPSSRITLHAPGIDDKCKVWVDDSLLREALLSLLDQASKRALKNRITLSLSWSDMHDLRIAISYDRPLAHGGEQASPFGRPRNCSLRAQSIIEQHRSRIDFEDKDGVEMIGMRFPYP